MRWSVRLIDRAQERRFVIHRLPMQRRTTLAAAVFVVALLAGELVYQAVFRPSELSRSDVRVSLAALVAGLALIALLRRDRTPKLMVKALFLTGMLLPALVGAVIIAGVPVGAQGTLLLVGGVIVVYLPARLDLAGTVAAAVAFSAWTIPAWLLSGIATSNADAICTLAAVGLAHVLCVIEARRSLRESRLQFAQTEAFERLSSMDSLTALDNRRAFAQRLGVAWRSSYAPSTPLSLLMIDIDHFKRLNDTRGHAAGDVALRVVADTIRARVVDIHGGVAARYGGEEFTVLLPEVGHVAAIEVADTIRANLRAAAIPAGARGTAGGAAAGGDAAGDKSAADNDDALLTVSIGVASRRPEMTLPDELVAAADRELYRAKADGRDCVRNDGDPTPVTAS